jgi:hypothetical protein
MSDQLWQAVLRFCAQLRREGYRTDWKEVANLCVISAHAPDGRLAWRYAVLCKGGGIHIRELATTAGGPAIPVTT